MEDKLCFESNLTKKELQKNFDGKDYLTEVMIGLEEALDFCKGNALSSVVVHKRTEQMSRKQKNQVRIICQL